MRLVVVIFISLKPLCKRTIRKKNLPVSVKGDLSDILSAIYQLFFKSFNLK